MIKLSSRSSWKKTYITNKLIIPYKNARSGDRSYDSNTTYFNTIVGVLQRNKIATYLFMLSIDYVLQISADKNREFRLNLPKLRSSI